MNLRLTQARELIRPEDVTHLVGWVISALLAVAGLVLWLLGIGTLLENAVGFGLSQGASVVVCAGWTFLVCLIDLQRVLEQGDSPTAGSPLLFWGAILAAPCLLVAVGAWALISVSPAVPVVAWAWVGLAVVAAWLAVNMTLWLFAKHFEDMAEYERRLEQREAEEAAKADEVARDWLILDEGGEETR